MRLKKLICGLLVAQLLSMHQMARANDAVPESSELGVQVVYRLYNPILKEHLFTTDQNEYQVLPSHGWKQEGIAWYAPSQNGTKVTRLYSKVTKKHLYTLDQNEVNKLLSTRLWTKDGMAMQSGGGHAIYRLYHPGVKSHLLTANGNEYNVLGTRGWSQEGGKIQAVALYSPRTSSSGRSRDAIVNQPPTKTPADSKPTPVAVKNTIRLSSEYVSAVQRMSKSGLEEYESLRNQLTAVSASLKSQNRYQANPSDSQAVIDTNNLTVAQLQELSLFAEDLINQVRSQVGTYPVSVSNGSVSMVDEITDMCVAHDFLGAGHYNAAINQVAQKYGLPSDATNESQVYENLNTYGISSPTISMAQAKEYVYNSIVRGFLFNGFEYGHALSILGLHDKGTEYVAVDVSSRTNATSVHFIFVPTVDANRSAVFDQNRVKK